MGIALGNTLLIDFDTVVAIILGFAPFPSSKSFVPRGPATTWLYRYRNVELSPRTSKPYEIIYNQIFDRIYDIQPGNGYAGADGASRWRQFNTFYGLSTPTAPPLDKPAQPLLTIDKLKSLHAIAMFNNSDKEHKQSSGHFRRNDVWAYSPWPVVYAPPEQIVPLMNEFCDWFNSWWMHVGNLSSIEFERFTLSLIPRIVVVHPYKDGNKRTARLLANVLLYGRVGYVFNWDYTDEAKRKNYQIGFGEASMTGDFSLIMNMHRKAKKSHGKSNKDMKDDLDALWESFVEMF